MYAPFVRTIILNSGTQSRTHTHADCCSECRFSGVCASRFHTMRTQCLVCACLPDTAANEAKTWNRCFWTLLCECVRLYALASYLNSAWWINLHSRDSVRCMLSCTQQLDGFPFRFHFIWFRFVCCMDNSANVKSICRRYEISLVTMMKQVQRYIE